jgi:hypothetical protein
MNDKCIRPSRRYSHDRSIPKTLKKPTPQSVSPWRWCSPVSEKNSSTKSVPTAFSHLPWRIHHENKRLQWPNFPPRTMFSVKLQLLMFLFPKHRMRFRSQALISLRNREAKVAFEKAKSCMHFFSGGLNSMQAIETIEKLRSGFRRFMREFLRWTRTWCENRHWIWFWAYLWIFCPILGMIRDPFHAGFYRILIDSASIGDSALSVWGCETSCGFIDFELDFRQLPFICDILTYSFFLLFSLLGKIRISILAARWGTSCDHGWENHPSGLKPFLHQKCFPMRRTNV